ncbi:hypothetical protein DPSP01_005245 [Paraphaeosphaeria sporulosa]|uniref:Uncharacterized protein n=1 Tax=Paraphaeosphaeria sporulosa TaxID=1460663 RepID=A0A177C4I6_9PLEO|nr:uncharacterized protein CC84DRAFT_1009118 [Paraphaeosphaeria sporulosa]OAG02326.1 hypothetical protein CC84DRAFT_1009118 [Paraphaeosphaeria sporulosa]
MANLVPEYYLAPTWEIPRHCSIKLSNIISSIKQPQRPLANIHPPDYITTSHKTSLTCCKRKMSSKDVSIITSFLSFMGVGTDAGANRGKSNMQNLGSDYFDTAQSEPMDM